MIRPSIIIAITKKDLRQFMDSPTAYIVLVVFLLLWEFLFFRSAFLVGEASLAILFDYLPWLLLLFIPAMTMGSFAQEKREGTIELLLTHPVKESELVLGKFFARLFFTSIAILFAVPIAYALAQFGNLDWGVVLGQIIAGISLAAIFIGFGLFISSFLSHQITALMLTAAGSFLLTIAGFEFVTARLPFRIATLLEQFSPLTHFDAMARGVIDTRNIWYVITAIIILLSLTYFRLRQEKVGNRPAVTRRAMTATLIFIGIAIGVNLLGARLPGRLDLTEQKRYTLSTGTRTILTTLPDQVTITLFTSDQLPAQMQPILREVKDILADYDTLGGERLLVAQKNPSNDKDAIEHAQRLGIKPMQFNVIGQEQFELKQGYLGIGVERGDKAEAIPFIQETKDLEYQLTSFLVKLTREEKRTIYVTSGSGEKNIYTDYGQFRKELEKQFNLQVIRPDSGKGGEETLTIPEDADLLLIAGPSATMSASTVANIQSFLASDKALLVLNDVATINPQLLTATPNTTSLNDLLASFGIRFEPQLVYDLRSNETISFGSGPFRYFLPYPFWIHALPIGDLPFSIRVENILMPWAGRLTIDTESPAQPLLVTTQFGGVQSEPFSIAPDQSPSSENLGEQTIAAWIESPRIMAIADANFLTDDFITNSPENLSFGLASIEWLLQEERLAGIRAKQSIARNLLFPSPIDMSIVKYGNMGLVVFIPLIIGGIQFLHRRRLRLRLYITDTAPTIES